MAAVAILKNRKIAISQQRLNLLPQNFHILKIQVGGDRHLEKSKNCHISATVRPIAKKFGLVTHVDPFNPVDR